MIILTYPWKVDIMNATEKNIFQPYRYKIRKTPLTKLRNILGKLSDRIPFLGILRTGIKEWYTGVVWVLPCPALQLMLMGDISLSPVYLLTCTAEMKYLLIKVKLLSVEKVLSVSIKTLPVSCDRNPSHTSP